MGINYERGSVDDTVVASVEQVGQIFAMFEPSDAYCDCGAVEWNASGEALIDGPALTYEPIHLSEEACPDDWCRIIRVPMGYIVDISHWDTLFDESGRLQSALPEHIEINPEDSDEVLIIPAIDVIKNVLELRAAEGIFREQFNYVLGDNVLLPKSADSEDPREDS